MGANGGDGTSVLLIDADRAASALLSLELRRRGCSVRVAESLHSGLAMSGTDRPAVIVTEQVLPDGCVLPLLPEFRTMVPQATILILTRYASVAGAVLALRRGAAGYLAKPADPRELATELGLDSRSEGRSQTRGRQSVMTLDQVEWEHINGVVLGCGGNVSEAARYLKMHRRTLQRKLAKGGPRSAV